MSLPTVLTLPDDGQYDRREILRYARIAGGEADGLPLDECLALASGHCPGKIVWYSERVQTQGSELSIGPVRTASKDLRLCLSGCSEAIIFAATVGVHIDRLIARYKNVSPVRALLLHAIGAERVEHICDRFTEQLAAMMGKGRLRPRFSPGYGDLPLSLQPDIFALLDCERQIGLTLNQSLIMSPSKSVTAIIGISEAQYGNA